MFGLSQLYQLRGRVGRSKTRAYAYYTLPHRKKLSNAATRRLEVMQTLDNLGAGFTLASHDMDIRGFGNLVGDEQSGHVKEVGIELYQQMLEEAVTAAKAKKNNTAIIENDDYSPQINLGISVLIPESYVNDLDLRLGLYRRLASLNEIAEIEAFAVELIDRFGKLPIEVQRLLAVMHIKQLCKQAGIEKIDAGPKGLVISFRFTKNNATANSKTLSPESLIKYVQKNPLTAKIRPDSKLFLAREFLDAESKLKGVKDAIMELVLIIK
jgi:transcription-repair coupling factor (superfamily II helicase)